MFNCHFSLKFTVNLSFFLSHLQDKTNSINSFEYIHAPKRINPFWYVILLFFFLNLWCKTRWETTQRTNFIFTFRYYYQFKMKACDIEDLCCMSWLTKHWNTEWKKLKLIVNLHFHYILIFLVYMWTVCLIRFNGNSLFTILLNGWWAVKTPRWSPRLYRSIYVVLYNMLDYYYIVLSINLNPAICFPTKVNPGTLHWS